MVFQCRLSLMSFIALGCVYIILQLAVSRVWTVFTCGVCFWLCLQLAVSSV